MIKEVSGDILLSRADLLAHGISAQDPFDSGLALAGLADGPWPRVSWVIRFRILRVPPPSCMPVQNQTSPLATALERV